MNDRIKTYEGMFLLDAGAGDFQAASEPVRAVLERYQAEVLALKPWDERKLAYEVEGRKRGLYALVYFKAPTGSIAEIEHDCQLSDQILRVMILRRERLTEEEIKAETPATGARRAPETLLEESDDFDRDRRGPRRDHRDRDRDERPERRPREEAPAEESSEGGAEESAE